MDGRVDRWVDGWAGGWQCGWTVSAWTDTGEKGQMEGDNSGQTGCGAAPQGLFNKSTAWALLPITHNQGHLPGGQGRLGWEDGVVVHPSC